jgi:hypothetical protein
MFQKTQTKIKIMIVSLADRRSISFAPQNLVILRGPQSEGNFHWSFASVKRRFKDETKPA